jgi:hypothetical protein
MVNKKRIRALAEAERLMDQGAVPWVWAPNDVGNYERMAVSPTIMTDLGLEIGQTVNTFIVDAIAELSLRVLAERIQDLRQTMEDANLDPNFDFRSMINDNNT